MLLRRSLAALACLLPFATAAGQDRLLSVKDVSHRAALHPGGKLIASPHPAGPYVIDIATGETVVTLTGHGTVFGGLTGKTPSKAEVLDLAWDPDGKRLVTIGTDRVAIVWDWATGEELCRLEGHKAGLRQVTFSPDGTRIATGDSGGGVKVWDSTTGACTATPAGLTKQVYALAFAPDGKALAAADDSKAVQVWEAATGDRLARMRVRTTPESLAFSPDGKSLACGSNFDVDVWDAATGKVRHHFRDESGAPLHLVYFSVDGKTLVNANTHKVTYRDLGQGGKKLGELFIAHPPGEVNWMRPSMDGQTLVFGMMKNWGLRLVTIPAMPPEKK